MSNPRIAVYSALEKMVGPDAADRLYQSICIRRYRRAACVFIHIPKAAGTSIAEATLGRRAGHYTAAQVKAAMKQGEFESLFSFAVTRHPLDRLISAYRYARHGGGADGGIRHDPIYDSDCFRSFDAFVHEWLSNQVLDRIDYVFMPQTPFVYKEGACIVDYVGKVENLDEVEARLTAALRRPVRIPKKNTGHATAAQNVNIAWETRQSVYNLYREDFERFGYKIEL